MAQSATRGFASYGGTRLLGVSSPAARARTKRRAIKDPHFGEVLFFFFQENYFSALTLLMTAQHFARVPRSRRGAELLRGGMLLSYGLHSGSRAYLHLIERRARLRRVRDRPGSSGEDPYQVAMSQRPEDAIARVHGPLARDLEDERLVLHAGLLLRRQPVSSSYSMLRRRQSVGWAAYDTTTGCGADTSGRARRGVELLDEIGRDRARGEELTRCGTGQRRARVYFPAKRRSGAGRTLSERVRLNGLLSNKALLGLGWTHAALNEY